MFTRPQLPVRAAAALAVLAAASILAPPPAGASPNIIRTVAGTGAQGYTGDGHAARLATLNNPESISPLHGGGFLIADTNNDAIRRVSTNGTITTVAGGTTAVCAGATDPVGDGCPATQASLGAPTGVAALPGGAFLIAEEANDRIREVSAAGIITSVAGTGVGNYGGDNGPATSAQVFHPQGVAPLPGGGFLIADSNNARIRMVSATGTITTVAGDGTQGYNGDNMPATSAELFLPTSVRPLPGGAFLIADYDNSRIRMVSAGTITTVAGSTLGSGGDNGPATSANLAFPRDVSVVPGGGFLIADQNNNRVRRVSSVGTITTAAGSGTFGFSGDGGPAVQAKLSLPQGVAALGGGQFLFADTGHNRIAWVGPRPTTTLTSHPKAKRTTRKRHATVKFGFRSSQAGSTFECKLDKQSFGPCISPKTYKVRTGRHKFTVLATNAFGAVGSAASFHFQVKHKKR